MTDAARAPSVYVDANPFIYFVEGEDAVANRLRPFFELLRRRPGTAATSELTLAEVLPKARPDARRSYLNLIVWSNLFHLQPVTREILIDTADFRRTSMRTLANGQRIMPKLPDAIHVVTAARIRCRAILSADSGLKVPSGISVFEPDEAGVAKLLQEIA
jgi:predicted nucleic acid-binding protein